MVVIKEIILNNIMATVQQELTAVQLQMLETTLRLNLRGIFRRVYEYTRWNR